MGWAALELDDGSPTHPVGLIDSGVRIFSDGRNPKDGQSLAVSRRLPRQMRRRRDRYLKRRDEFMERLIAHGLMPTDASSRKALEALDPWILRARALDEKLSLHEIGRALFHLQQRRGFKSNRTADADDDDRGKVAEATARTIARMQEQGARTLGEWLGAPRRAALAANGATPKGGRAPLPAARARLRGEGASAAYEFYPTRDLIAAEFDAIWSAQREFHGEALGGDAYAALRDTLLFQRPLKPQPVGKCTLLPREPRAPRALPTVQRLRIYQEINHLEIQEPGQRARKLSLEERDQLVEKALATAQLKFDVARKLIGASEHARFNIERDARRAYLDGDKTAAALAARACWGQAWRELSLEDQDEVVERLLADADETALMAWLRAKHGLDEERAIAVSRALNRLPDGHGALGRTASRRILKSLMDGVLTYSAAVEASGFDLHSQFGDGGDVKRRLPYYGKLLERQVAFGSGDPDDPEEKRFGKVANPTVHVALNQLRRVYNAIVARYGAPSEIVVELARELPLSAVRKRELERQHKDNKDANDRRRALLAELGQLDSYENRMLLRLWEELNPADQLDRRCPYSGEPISIARLFSGEVEIDHILPFSRTLDDSAANKTVGLRSANRFKGRRSPFEAFGESPAPYDWSSIVERAASMPANKLWRFGPDAMERFENVERDFLARQLTDTSYLSRLAKAYLEHACGSVWVTPGQLTAQLRRALGLDSVLPGHNVEGDAPREKNRNDHRHHAVDAIVVALTDQALLRRAATLAARSEDEHRSKLLAGLEVPWPAFRDDVRDAVGRIVVSHKPEHGVEGALHNDTAYGLATPPDPDGRCEGVRRAPLAEIKSAKDLEKIRDPVLRDRLIETTSGLQGKDFAAALATAGEEMRPPVRRVRILETVSVVTVSDAKGRPYKAHKRDANYCFDVFADAAGRWRGGVVSMFDANQPGFDPEACARADGTPLVMRLRKGDVLALGSRGAPSYLRVVKFSKGGAVLADHAAAGALKARDADPDDPFRYVTAGASRLQRDHARLVTVDPSGRIFALDSTDRSEAELETASSASRRQ